jgi:hypothetical protein
MPDPLSTEAIAELPHGPLIGLRRRHQAGLVFQRNNEENEGADNVDDIVNRDSNENVPLNNGTDLPSQQAPLTPTTNNANNNGGGGGVNRNTAAVGRQPSSPPTNLFSLLSGSIGIGVFRISRLYCFLSIMSALLVIVLAPIPTHKIVYHDLVTMMGGNGLILKNSPIQSTIKGAENDDHVNIGGNMNSIAKDLKTWSVEEIITHAAFKGVAASQKRGLESSKVGVSSIEVAGNEQRKRRRRPAVLAEQYHSNSPVTPGGVADSTGEMGGAKESLFSSTPSKAKTSPGNQNKNTDDSSLVPIARLRNWIERMNTLAEDTVTEIILRRKKIHELAVEPNVRWKDSLNNDDTTSYANGHEGKSGCSDDEKEENECSDTTEQTKKVLDGEWQWIDPIFFEDVSFSNIFTNIIDKVLKSTIRLCIITNFLLTMTYLLHSAVAAWFLSHFGSAEDSNNTASMRVQHERRLREDPATMVSEWSFPSSSGATGARERMGGFLIFKLLLISAVLAPDTLDLMILVTWFTLLGCLRSLDHLAHSTNIHLVAMGQPPRKGIVQLLFWVLACDIVAAGFCMALFHTAGYGMVLLLTCDCALLGTDAASHVLKYYQSVLENSHDNDFRVLEERQLDLHRVNENEDGFAYDNIEDEAEREREYIFIDSAIAAMTPTERRQESGRLDHQMESLELAHNRRLSILDTATFCLDMTCHILTVAHFCHIWALHGVQFTLIDGVLALHLHSAISTSCAKLARRRNVHKIARDLEGHFPNATDEELKQASADGDVCCICLGSMTKGGNVKKVHCGHIYHTHCLREVIERAQNLESAKCPLCRAPLVGNCHSINDASRRNGIFNSTHIHQNNPPVGPRIPAVQAANNPIDSGIEGDGGGGGDDAVPVRQVEGERALFRFSTEGFLPAWLPVPHFSFEVIRRPAQRGAQPQNQQIQNAAPVPTQRIDPVAALSSNQEEANPELPTEPERQAPQLEQQQDTQLPFFQRILRITGLIPMSPEEEARALMQLVDMFPQYDRSDLSRELRNRGSVEAVTEAILMGIFSGVPRGE